MTLPLGRLQPPDWEHVEKYPLATLAQDDNLPNPPKHVPVAMGVNWYTNFDAPVEKTVDGKKVYVVGMGSLGSIRGGHCFCLEPNLDKTQKGGEQDAATWYPFYNQGEEGSCEGHGHSRLMSLLHRKRFDAVWLYNEARRIDGDPDPNHEGTTNRAACEVMRTQGMRVAHGDVTTSLTSSEPASKDYAVKAYRWARSADEILSVLGLPSHQEYVTILNSWGKAYPHRVLMPVSVLERLLNEAGEASVITEA